LIGDKEMRLAIFIALATLGLVACKPPTPSYTVTDPKTGEKTKISVDAKGQNKTVTVSSGEGKGTISVTTPGDVPKNLPAYVPPYPGAKYEGSFVSDMQGTPKEGAVSGGMMSFKTSDSADKVLAFYKDAFTKAGLKDGASGDMGGLKMISFTKGDTAEEGAQVMASATPSGETQVQVMYSVGQ
jgi:hypothetical protein